MARKPREEPSGDAWMNTYSDLVTLLMTFFVLLFSMSSVNAEKWEAFVKAFVNPGDATSQIVLDNDGKEDGDEPLPNTSDAQQIMDGVSPSDQPSTLPTDFDDLYAFLQEYVAENNLGNSVEVMKSGDNVVYIRFQNNIFFDPDKATLRAEGIEVLGYLGDCFYAVQDDIYVISINGHTAAVDDPNYSVSDWVLSAERASRVADYLDITKHVEATKLRPMGYGKSFPIADNDTAEGRRKNRRVDMTIVRSSDDSAGQQRVEDELASLFDPNQFPKEGGALDLLTPGEEGGDAAGATPDAPSGTEPAGGETPADGTEPTGTEPTGTEPSGTEPTGTEPPTDTPPADAEPPAGTEPAPSSPES